MLIEGGRSDRRVPDSVRKRLQQSTFSAGKQLPDCNARPQRTLPGTRRYHNISYHIVVLKRQNRLKVGRDKPKLNFLGGDRRTLNNAKIMAETIDAIFDVFIRRLQAFLKVFCHGFMFL